VIFQVVREKDWLMRSGREHGMRQMKREKTAELLKRGAFSYQPTEPLAEVPSLGVTALILFDKLKMTHADLAQVFDVIRTMPNNAPIGDLRHRRIVRQLHRIVVQLAEL
jgi:hypothetical protein